MDAYFETPHSHMDPIKILKKSADRDAFLNFFIVKKLDTRVSDPTVLLNSSNFYWSVSSTALTSLFIIRHRFATVKHP